MDSARVIRLDLAYDGTRFQGFSVQPGQRTVQGELEAAWLQINDEAIRVTPAGRTDTGVHASGQVGSVRTVSARPVTELARALNATLPRDIAILAVSEASWRFDARRSAQRRHYRYTLWTGPVRNVFWQQYSWHVTGDLDFVTMQRVSSCLVGRHDFRGFGARLSRSAVESTERVVERLEWSRDGSGFVHLDITANGFIRRMVRGIVGSVVAVGLGRQAPEDVVARLRGVNVTGRVEHAPAHGLTLTQVDY